MSSADPRATEPVAAFRGAGDRLIGGFGWIAVFGLPLGLLSVMAINQYGGMMSMISIRDCFKPVRPTVRIRAIGIGTMFVMVWGIAQFVGIDRFDTFYAKALIFLAYLFTPWTAINQVDFFRVRRGNYVISEIFRADGIYGRWGWRGNVAYLVALAAMVPFMVTIPFTGFIARAAGGVDHSIVVGLPVAGLFHLVLCRDLDLATEQRLVQEEGIHSGVH